jgi:hypothetical protein
VEPKQTVGQAIDTILSALDALEKRQQQTVVLTVCSLLDLPLADLDAGARNRAAHAVARTDSKDNPPPAPVVLDQQRQGHIDIKTLKDEKQPDSARQMACVVAYYLQELAPEADRKQTVTVADIEKYFKQARYPLPVKLGNLLPTVKDAGYFETVARGEYRLTRVGYNLVAHSLPKSPKA